MTSYSSRARTMPLSISTTSASPRYPGVGLVPAEGSHHHQSPTRHASALPPPYPHCDPTSSSPDSQANNQYQSQSEDKYESTYKYEYEYEYAESPRSSTSSITSSSHPATNIDTNTTTNTDTSYQSVTGTTTHRRHHPRNPSARRSTEPRSAPPTKNLRFLPSSSHQRNNSNNESGNSSPASPGMPLSSTAMNRRHSHEPRRNLYTECGRHSDAWLFGGFSVSGAVKKMWSKDREREGRGDE